MRHEMTVNEVQGIAVNIVNWHPIKNVTESSDLTTKKPKLSCGKCSIEGHTISECIETFSKIENKFRHNLNVSIN